MSAIDLGWYAQQGLLWWIILLAALVLWRLWQSPEALGGLLVNDSAEAGHPGTAQADRMQLLLTFAFALGGYVLEVVKAMGDSAGALTAMPEVPQTLLTILAGSQAIYVSGKVARTVSAS